MAADQNNHQNGNPIPGAADNRRILIVDDERPILLTLEALLGRHGYQVETAATASLGLKFLKSKPPALVLLDQIGRAHV